MPWKPKDAVHKTRSAKSPAKKKRWAETANAVLRETGDEGLAIRVANSKVKGERK